jgi:acid phosphatase family membrane protein YuiD
MIWMLIYVLTAASFTAIFYVWAKLGQPPTHSAVMRASSIAVASLRGMTAALVSVSLALDFRLRTLHQCSSGPER